MYLFPYKNLINKRVIMTSNYGRADGRTQQRYTISKLMFRNLKLRKWVLCVTPIVSRYIKKFATTDYKYFTHEQSAFTSYFLPFKNVLKCTTNIFTHIFGPRLKVCPLHLPTYWVSHIWSIIGYLRKIDWRTL